MGRFTGKTCRLLTMIGLTTIFFLVEIIVGYATGSVALIADSFHMLSDIISLIVGLTAVKMSKKTTSKNTYGWQRAEVLGALVNSVFLLALCFTIVVEAVQRFIEIEEITNPQLVLIVGGVGMFINVIGLALFWTHGMSHGHSHGGGSSHSHGGKSKPKPAKQQNGSSNNYTKVEQGDDVVTQPNGFSYTEIEDSSSEGTQSTNQNQNSKHLTTIDITPSSHDDDDEHPGEGEDASGQLNMRGVFLHVLGDALGSVVVIISALFIMLTDYEWRYYVDPIMSLIIVFIIIGTTIPLFKQSSMILLQSLPTDVDIEDIEDRLLRKVGGIENVHEFHIWQLSSDKVIATAHIRFSSIQDYMKAAQELKTFLHNEGIHSTTIQPEFSSDMLLPGSEGTEDCILKCLPDADCGPQTTCCDRQNSVKHRRKSSDKGRRKSEPLAPLAPPPQQKSSVWSRMLRFTGVRSNDPLYSEGGTESPVDSDKTPLLQRAQFTPKNETAMGVTLSTGDSSPGQNEETV